MPSEEKFEDTKGVKQKSQIEEGRTIQLTKTQGQTIIYKTLH